jgi:23S rRNA G2445 N2-methylase RlmL
MNCETCNAELAEDTTRSCCDECEAREQQFRSQAAAAEEYAAAMGNAAANAHEAGVKAGIERQQKLFAAIGISLLPPSK